MDKKDKVKGRITMVDSENFAVDGKTFTYAEVKSVERDGMTTGEKATVVAISGFFATWGIICATGRCSQ